MKGGLALGKVKSSGKKKVQKDQFSLDRNSGDPCAQIIDIKVWTSDVMGVCADAATASSLSRGFPS
jgi:hypothetical protein